MRFHLLSLQVFASLVVCTNECMLLNIGHKIVNLIMKNQLKSLEGNDLVEVMYGM
jgi:hypothetical protein